jgi:methylmalonyl-CoA mutase N-terminal domain/subunit
VTVAREQPGEFPYTRGIHRDMYRGKLWTMRQFAGFATPEETNARYRYLLSQGQTGLSVAFDLPTLMGLDADAPEAVGEVGKCGAPVSSLADMEALVAGIPLDSVTISMTINSPAIVIWAMYLVAAEKQGVAFSALSGTLQNDILKEYIAQKEFIFPPRASLRLVTDTVEFSTERTPRFNPISVSGYHIREAGSTAAQELAFTLADGFEYVDWALKRGLAVDSFAPRLSFFFNSDSNFFEEIAKFRAARRIWAVEMRERYGARSEQSCKLRFHAQTAGASLTWQQPYNNVVRTGLQALAAVLGGAQSLHTNSLDEAYALPSEEAALLALRTQQVIACETGITEVPDPFGGSVYLEGLTDGIEAAARAYIHQIRAMGGMVAAIENGFPQSEIAQASYQAQGRIESKQRIVVGVNGFVSQSDAPLRVLRVSGAAEQTQCAKLKQLRAERDNGRVQRALATVIDCAKGTGNMMEPVLAAVRAYATVGEICGAMLSVFGGYREKSIL